MGLSDDPNTRVSCVARADAVAAKLDIRIPDAIARDFWVVPILEKFLERIEQLEDRVLELERRNAIS